jgi:hypothetical protein
VGATKREELHGNNSYSDPRKRAIVIEAATKLIAYGEEEMDYDDRQLLLPPNKDQFLESNTTILDAWTQQTNRPAILKAASDNATRNKLAVRKIESYFTRTNTNTNTVPAFSEPPHDPPPGNDNNSPNESQMTTQNDHQDRQNREK